MTDPRRRRRPSVLAVAAALTVLVVLAGLGGAALPERVRTTAATALGPLERGVAALVPAPAGSAAAVEQRRSGWLAANADADRSALDRLAATPSLAGAVFVPARLVAVGRPGPSGPERLTLDVGSRDGIAVDTTVVSEDGLVGRVVSVSPWTCDVAVLGAPDVVVGVRVGDSGVIGTVAPGPSSGGGSGEGTGLRLDLVEQGEVRVGDAVTTLGSVDDRPFAAGIPVGTVTAVISPAGRATVTAVVEPAMALSRSRVVGVLRTEPRAEPRPAVTAGAS